MLDIEHAIREVGAVYQALTGRAIAAGQADLPHDVEPRAHIEERYQKLKEMLASPAAGQAQAAQAAHVANAPVWSPAMEVVELEREVRYEIDLPAVLRTEVSVAVVGDCLVVTGRRAAPAIPGAAIRFSERPVGPFQKVVALPSRARREAIHASLREGVLSIAIPTEGVSPGPLPVDVK
jgi:HSP20 family protein